VQSKWTLKHNETNQMDKTAKTNSRADQTIRERLVNTDNAKDILFSLRTNQAKIQISSVFISPSEKNKENV